MFQEAARILIAVWLIATAHAAVAEKRIALVIGNGAYTNTPPLANPKNDAEDMAAALRALGFTVISGLDLDKRSMDRKILEFESELHGADAGVFHYSGHGLQVSGVNYLVPVDASLESAAALRIEAVRLDFIQETMEREAKRTSCSLMPAATILSQRAWPAHWERVRWTLAAALRRSSRASAR